MVSFSCQKNPTELISKILIHRYCILESPSAADRSDLLMELYILKEVNKNPHPNVINLIGAFTSEGICDTYLYVMAKTIPLTFALLHTICINTLRTFALSHIFSTYFYHKQVNLF